MRERGRVRGRERETDRQKDRQAGRQTNDHPLCKVGKSHGGSCEQACFSIILAQPSNACRLWSGSSCSSDTLAVFRQIQFTSSFYTLMLFWGNVSREHRPIKEEARVCPQWHMLCWREYETLWENVMETDNTVCTVYQMSQRALNTSDDALKPSI